MYWESNPQPQTRWNLDQWLLLLAINALHKCSSFTGPWIFIIIFISKNIAFYTNVHVFVLYDGSRFEWCRRQINMRSVLHIFDEARQRFRETGGSYYGLYGWNHSYLNTRFSRQPLMSWDRPWLSGPGIHSHSSSQLWITSADVMSGYPHVSLRLPSRWTAD